MLCHTLNTVRYGIRGSYVIFFFFCLSRASLEDRLKLEEHSGISNMANTAVGSKQLTFTLKKVIHQI